MIAWEVTRACAFACVHCRADAQPRRSPLELTTQEGFALIDRLTELGTPILVFTGGDPMMRRDLFDLADRADRAGLRCSLTPRATALPRPPYWVSMGALAITVLAGARIVEMAVTRDLIAGLAVVFWAFATC